MLGSNELILIAELALGYAGFMAIFLIFARRKGHFNLADAFRIRSIIAASFFALFGSLLPLLLNLYGYEGSSLWSMSSTVTAFVGMAIILPMIYLHISMNSDDLEEVGRFYSIAAWGLVASGELLVAFNALGFLGQPSAAIYVTAMVSLLGVATVNFVAITFRRFF